MTDSTLGIYNAAISAVRGRGRLTSLDQRTPEREECDIWYRLVVDTVQEAAFWPSCRKVVRLQLLSERNFASPWSNDDPEPPFRFKYALPSECLRPWYLTEMEYFTLSFDGTRRVLNTNSADATLVFAERNTFVGHWTPGQRQAVIYGLAAQICGAVSGQNELQSMNINMANQLLLEAQSHAANSMPRKLQAVPPGIAARNYQDSFQTSYYYPFGQMFNAGGSSNA